MAARTPESLGNMLVLTQSAIYGFFPVLITLSGGRMPPLLFAGVSMLIASPCLMVYLIITGKHRDVLARSAVGAISGVIFFTVILGFGLVTAGASLSSGINTSVLLLSEVVFTYLLCGIVFKEPMPQLKIVAGAVITLGCLFTVYNGSFSPNKGDLLTLIGAACFPIGNRFALLAMRHVSSASILFTRSLIGGLVLIILSFSVEETFNNCWALIADNLALLLCNGLIMFSLTKIIWYEGMKRMDMSKAIAMGLSYCAFGFVYSIVFLNEAASGFQLIGLGFVMLGILLMLRVRQ